MHTSISSLLLSAHRGDRLECVGSVGTGFKDAEARKLRAMLDKLAWKPKAPPVAYDGDQKPIWVKPALIAEIHYRAWTHDRRLRHASFKGLRERQDNADIYRRPN